jgi:LmbE family N-acetylglucosaminyl deacetylase
MVAQFTNRLPTSLDSLAGGSIPDDTEGNLPDRLIRISAPASSNLPLPRALLVLAHPDDETIAVGARLERFCESRLICVTNGAPRDGRDALANGFSSTDDYSSARYLELEAALLHAGLMPERILRRLKLGAGARHIADQDAAWRLDELTVAVAAQVENFQPEVVLTHPYEGGHPDHDACAFAVRAAIQLVGSLCDIVEAPFYRAGQAGIETGKFLPGTTAIVMRPLSATEKKNKQERLARFVTQAETLRQFATDVEQYRIAPCYDFTQQPHPGTLYYENFPWGITGAKFRELAAATLKALHIDGGNP